MAINEKALGPEYPNVATSLENYTYLLRKTGRADETAKMEARAKPIQTERFAIHTSGQKHALSGPLNRVWNAPLNRHTCPSVGNCRMPVLDRHLPVRG
jgi:hypothetical protein